MQREISRLRVKPASEVSTPSPVPATMGVTDEIDLFNTDYLAYDLQHGPIHDWFNRKQIKVQANTRNQWFLAALLVFREMAGIPVVPGDRTARLFNGDLLKDFAVMTNVNIVYQAFRVV